MTISRSSSSDRLCRFDIAATPLQGVIRLDRAYLRQDDTVWVMEDGKLRIREVAVLFLRRCVRVYR